MKTHGNSYVKGSCKNRVKPPNENPILSSDKLLKELADIAIELKVPDYLHRVVYFLIDGKEIVYVGKSENYYIYERVRDHRKNKKFDKVLVVPLHTEDKAIDVEQAFINISPTKYNKYRSENEFILGKSLKDAMSFIRKSIKRKKEGRISDAVTSDERFKEAKISVDKMMDVIYGHYYQIVDIFREMKTEMDKAKGSVSVSEKRPGKLPF